MPNVVRFALDSARDQYVSGVGFFRDGILDVDANRLQLVAKARYLVQPYRAVEIGTVDSATPKPNLPAPQVPPAPNTDPFPQYLTPAEARALVTSDPDVLAAQRAAFDVWAEDLDLGAGGTSVAAPEALGILYGGLARAQTQPVRIVGTGGSTMAGQGSSHTEAAWAVRLFRHVQGAYPSGGLTEADPVALNDVYAVPPTAPGVYFFQRAVSGNTTANYLDATARTRIAAVQPIAVLHQPISNDWATGIPPATTKANLLAHLADLRAKQTAPCVHILLSTQPRGDVNPATPFSDYVQVLKEIATEFPADVAVIDTVPAFERLGLPSPDPLDLLGPDITHLTDDGHRVQFDLVRQAIRLPGLARQDWVLRDRMRRADGAVGTADTGQAYTVAAGTYTITNDALVCAEGVGLISADVRETDVDASATVRITGGTIGAVGLGARVTGTTGRLLVAIDLAFQQIRLFKLISGANSDAVSGIPMTITVGRDYRLRIQVRGNTVTGWVDGTRIGPYTLTSGEQTALARATGVGFRHSGGDVGFGIAARDLGVKRLA